ncbi:MAG: hypothetical protein M1825_002319 [Sarcosagium campestre]|nr:MAG: hypothetical protein M1825_002319 [Sarcosagium campestre]
MDTHIPATASETWISNDQINIEGIFPFTEILAGTPYDSNLHLAFDTEQLPLGQEFQVPEHRQSSSNATERYLTDPNAPWVAPHVAQKTGRYENSNHDHRSNSGAHSNIYQNAALSDIGSCGRLPTLSDSGYATKSLATASVLSADPTDESQDAGSISGRIGACHLGTPDVTSLGPKSAGKRSRASTFDGSEAPSGRIKQSVIRCDRCSAVVKNLSALKKHMQRHEKLFKCEVNGCTREQGFSTSNDLDRHLLTVHKINVSQKPSVYWVCMVPGCKRYGTQSTRRDNFRSHLSRMHPEKNTAELLKASERRTGAEPEQSQHAIDTDALYDIHSQLGPSNSQVRPLKRRHADEAGSGQDWVTMSSPKDGLRKRLRFTTTTQDHDRSESKATSRNLLEMDAQHTGRDESTGRSEVLSTPAADSVGGFEESWNEAFSPLLSHGMLSDSGILMSKSPSLRELSADARQISRSVSRPQSPDIPDRGDDDLSHDAEDGSLPKGLDEFVTDLSGELLSRLPLVFARDSIHDGRVTISSKQLADVDSPGQQRLPSSTADWLGNEDDRSSERRTISYGAAGLTKGPDEARKRFQHGLKDLLRDRFSKYMVTFQGPKTAKNASAHHETGYALRGRLFRCDTCGVEKTHRHEMNKHQLRHKKVFACTYAGCKSRFGRKNDWKRHENSQHFQVELWRCRRTVNDLSREECAHVAYRREQFHQHLKDVHQIATSETILEESKACRIGRNLQTQYWCGFCGEIRPLKSRGLAAWKERFDHIGKHFKESSIDEWTPIDRTRANQDDEKSTVDVDERLDDGPGENSTPSPESGDGILQASLRAVDEYLSVPIESMSDATEIKKVHSPPRRFRGMELEQDDIEMGYTVEHGGSDNPGEFERDRVVMRCCQCEGLSLAHHSNCYSGIDQSCNHEWCKYCRMEPPTNKDMFVDA